MISLLMILGVMIAYLTVSSNGLGIVSIVTIELMILLLTLMGSYIAVKTGDVSITMYLITILLIGGTDVTILLLLLLKVNLSK